MSNLKLFDLESPDEGENSDFSLRQCIPISKLEIPKQERLLPIGHTQIANDEGNVKELVEKLREALGVMNGNVSLQNSQINPSIQLIDFRSSCSSNCWSER